MRRTAIMTSNNEALTLLVFDPRAVGGHSGEHRRSLGHATSVGYKADNANQFPQAVLIEALQRTAAVAHTRRHVAVAVAATTQPELSSHA